MKESGYQKASWQFSVTGAKDMGEELKLSLQKHAGTVIIPLGILLCPRSLLQMTGARVRTAPGLLLTTKSSLSRQEESTKYFNFSASDEKSKKEAEHRYRVNNLSQRDLAVSINFWVPILLNGVAVWDVAVVAPSQSLPCVAEREPPRHPDFLTQIPGSLVLNCSIADCLRFRCDLPSFGVQEELEFILKGNLSFGWVSQTLQKKVLIVTVAEIMFDRSVYSQLPGQEAFLRAQTETVLEKYEVYNPIPVIAGSSVGGLVLLALITAVLYKLGFFKRQYKEMLEIEPGDTATFSREDVCCEAPNLPLS